MIATLEHISWNIFFGGYKHKNTPNLDSNYTPFLMKNFAYLLNETLGFDAPLHAITSIVALTTLEKNIPLGQITNYVA